MDANFALNRKIMMLVGAAALAWALVLWGQNYFFRSDWKNSSAYAESVQQISITKYRVTYRYVVDGHSYTFTNDETSRPDIGKVIPMAYDPKNPADSGLQHEGQYVVAVLATIFGLAMLLGGKFAKNK